MNHSMSAIPALVRIACGSSNVRRGRACVACHCSGNRGGIRIPAARRTRRAHNASSVTSTHDFTIVTMPARTAEGSDDHACATIVSSRVVGCQDVASVPIADLGATSEPASVSLNICDGSVKGGQPIPASYSYCFPSAVFSPCPASMCSSSSTGVTWALPSSATCDLHRGIPWLCRSVAQVKAMTDFVTQRQRLL